MLAIRDEERLLLFLPQAPKQKRKLPKFATHRKVEARERRSCCESILCRFLRPRQVVACVRKAERNSHLAVVMSNASFLLLLYLISWRRVVSLSPSFLLHVACALLFLSDSEYICIYILRIIKYTFRAHGRKGVAAGVMTLDSSKISIISSTKVDPDKLSNFGDTSLELAPQHIRRKEVEEKPCPLCCMMYGSIISSIAVFCVAASATAVSIVAEQRINYTINGAMRQIAWIAFPGTLVGATLHYLLCEAMWSNKNNSWGMAWTKAMVVNAAAWTLTIGTGTLGWRKVLPLTRSGRRLYHRFPIPADPLEVRVLRSSQQFFSGMGATYWLSGVASGHLGLLTCVSVCVATDRPYMMMAPQGGYARRCMPPWRRQHFEHLALGNAASVTQQGEAAEKRPSIQ